MAKCKHCGKEGPHFCSKLQRQITEDSDSSSFLTSMLVAAATYNALLGYAVGGDLVGALIGEPPKYTVWEFETRQHHG